MQHRNSQGGTAYGEMGANAVLAVLARMPFFTNAERVFWSVSICHDTPVFCRWTGNGHQLEGKPERLLTTGIA